jgi:hypothetical protein
MWGGTAIIDLVAVKVGGIYVSALGTRAPNEACKELQAVNGKVDFADYVVDLCFMTYEQGGMGADYAEGVGIGPGMVGRKQRRFIVKLEMPPTLTDRTSCQAWISDALARAAAIVRDYLPLKGKDYPADRLAAEVVELRERWVGHIKSTA